MHGVPRIVPLCVVFRVSIRVLLRGSCGRLASVFFFFLGGGGVLHGDTD